MGTYYSASYLALHAAVDAVRTSAQLQPEEHAFSLLHPGRMRQPGLNHFALATKLVMGRNNMHEESDSADTGSAVSAAVPDV